MGTTHLSGLEVAGIPTFGIGGAPMFTGNWYFVDAVNGNDGNTGAADSPLATIYTAFSKMVSGNNDVCVIVGNGATSGTQRLSLANAQVATPSATTATLAWNKNACHLIGMTAPTGIAQRARLAPPATYNATTFAPAGGAIVNVTGSGCYFSNFMVWGGFSTNSATSIITWIAGGGRNYYNNVDFEGLADTYTAGDTGSSSLKVSSDENTFMNCTVGIDTVQRTGANASILFSGGAARNKFVGCDLPVWSNTATALPISAPTGSLDRWTKFERCCILNAIQSSGTALTGAIKIGAQGGGPNGLVLFKDVTSVGTTYLAYDATTAALLEVDGAAPTNSSSALAVVTTSHP